MREVRRRPGYRITIISGDPPADRRRTPVEPIVEGGFMAVVVHVTLRGVTPEQYDAVRARAGWIEQPPTGGISHTTWWEGEDCHNVDAWESEEAFAAFGEQRLAPAMAAAGVTAQPEATIHAAHEVFTPRVGIVAPTAKPTIGASDNVAIIRRGYEAFAVGDIDSVLR